MILDRSSISSVMAAILNVVDFVIIIVVVIITITSIVVWWWPSAMPQQGCHHHIVRVLLLSGNGQHHHHIVLSSSSIIITVWVLLSVDGRLRQGWCMQKVLASHQIWTWGSLPSLYILIITAIIFIIIIFIIIINNTSSLVIITSTIVRIITFKLSVMQRQQQQWRARDGRRLQITCLLHTKGGAAQKCS